MKTRPSARAAAVASVAALAVPLAGCSTSSPGQGAGISVVAEVYPLAWIAEQVGGGRVSVATLVPAGTEVHAFEVSPQQVDELGRADLAVVSREVSAAVDDAVATNPPDHVVDAADLVTLRPAAQDGHPTGTETTFDPHTWLDVPGLPAVVDAVARTLTQIDPEGASTYGENAAALDERLATLDGDYRTGLSSCEQTTFVVTHPAFGYLADAYGLTQVGVSGFDEDTEPSPARVAQVADTARRAGVTTVFVPDTSNPKVADVIASDLGITVSTLSTITGADAGQDYISLAEANLAALRAGLGCS
ncbi:metal ABC transporter substrate-binding protein [Isoptericola sp. b441]|uniref:Metal ABC transporter substrate-binding protein n=1 Tax=Actinotalea lenta TaxID=3064654 RepID=A0ABT9DC71_9CELL|nr:MULTISPECIES: metal ABC transporter substrate-binding protein [unclassified Isoptericola]MDO8108096.1 metal ABC transporter substrate-binding protein [Isoptericola sp. b441]MDO8120235.1 metal ABC transporter substrate-binding protein [Isoptericola sp. b490]